MKSHWQKALAALGLCAALGGTMPAHAEVADADRAKVESMVKDYLMAHPEVLRDAMNELDRRDKMAEDASHAKIISEKSAALFDSPHQAVIGNPNGKVTLVRILRFNCGYCKQSLADIQTLLKTEPDLKVVLKDFPILAPGSVEAAHVAIALRNQFKGDKYWQFHSRLLATRGAVGGQQALDVAKDMGADMAKLDRDMKAPDVAANLKEVADLADSLNLTGTPTFVTGQDMMVGAVGLPELTTKLDNVRRCGRATCG